LILSKTVTLEVDLSEVHVILIDDEPCRVIISFLYKSSVLFRVTN